MEPRKHAGFRIALVTIGTLTGVLVVFTTIALVSSIIYQPHDTVEGIIIVAVTWGTGRGLFALVNWWYRHWQKNDLITRKKANQRRNFKRLHQTKVR